MSWPSAAKWVQPEPSTRWKIRIWTGLPFLSPTGLLSCALSDIRSAESSVLESGHADAQRLLQAYRDILARVCIIVTGEASTSNTGGTNGQANLSEVNILHARHNTNWQTVLAGALRSAAGCRREIEVLEIGAGAPKVAKTSFSARLQWPMASRGSKHLACPA